MNRITKKMLMLFVLLLGMQELSHAAVEPPMTSKFGRGLGGVVAVGGLGVMGYEGWNLYQATNKVINQRTEKGIETDMSDFETLKTVLTLALKNRRVSKPKAALGLALCLGGLVGSGLSHRSITKVHEQNITTESNRVNAHKVLVEDANLFENVERNAFKNSSPKNEADLKKLKEIQDKLDAPKKVKIILADIDFLKTDSPKTYAKYLAEIAAHNEAANVAGRNAEAKKWNKFFNDYTAAAIFDRIYLTADICGNGALTHDLASLNRWKAANEPLLTYLIANGFEKMAASEKGTAGELILIVPNAGLAATHKAIYDIFIVEVKKNNFEYLNAEVKKKQVAMAQEAKKANGNPQFLEFDLLLKSISKEAHEKRNDYFVTEPANGLPAEDYAVSNIEETYKNFLKNQLVARAQKLELVTKAHGKGLTLLSKAYFGKPLNYDLKNENDVNKILDDLKWMFAAKQSLDSRAAAGPAQKRQKYDLLKHLNDEIKHINDNKKKIVLEQIAAWHSKDAKSTAADILKPSAAFFTEIYTVVNEIGYAALQNPQDTDDEVKAMKELENATKCFHSDYKIIIDKALAALKSDDNGHTKAYSLFLNQGKLDKIKFFPPGALNINGTFDAAIMALKVNLSYSVWGWVWEDTNDKLTLMTSSDFWMHFAGW